MEGAVLVLFTNIGTFFRTSDVSEIFKKYTKQISEHYWIFRDFFTEPYVLLDNFTRQYSDQASSAISHLKNNNNNNFIFNEALKPQFPKKGDAGNISQQTNSAPESPFSSTFTTPKKIEKPLLSR